MRILGIETSCDETAAAVVANGRKILSNVVASQIDIHREFGGVVPEVAARSHIETILPVVEKALKEAKLEWSGVDAMAVTYGPGLPGALLVGTLAARTLALAKNKPLYPIDHVKAHIYANWLDLSSHPERSASEVEGSHPPKFPILALIVSGGHSQLVLMRDHHDFEVLGATRDDAAGEAFDKAAKMLGLGFPGGPAVARAALKGDRNRYEFTKPKLDSPYDFSFSGLKTAALRQAQSLAGKDHRWPSHKLAGLLNDQQKHDLAASFEHAIVTMMVDAAQAAYEQYQPLSVVIAGGVAANQYLREQLQKRLPVDINYAPPHLCTDNAAMIASCAFFEMRTTKSASPLDLEHDPSLSMNNT